MKEELGKGDELDSDMNKVDKMKKMDKMKIIMYRNDGDQRKITQYGC